jgi:hypothetical protein
MNFRARRDNHASAIPSILNDQADDWCLDVGRIHRVHKLAAEQPAIREKPFADRLLPHGEDDLGDGWRWLGSRRGADDGVGLDWSWRSLGPGERLDFPAGTNNSLPEWPAW